MNDDLDPSVPHAASPAVPGPVDPVFADPRHDAAPGTPRPALAAPAAARPARRGRPFWFWWLAVSAVLSLACILILGMTLGHLGHLGGDLGNAPLHVIVDGEEVGSGFNLMFGDLSLSQQVAMVAAVVLAVTVLLLVVPVVLVVVLGAVAIAMVAGIGVPLLAVAAVLLVLSSPFWIIGGLVWMVVRANRRASAMAAAAVAAGNGSATIGA